MLSVVVGVCLLIIGWRGWSVSAVRASGQGRSLMTRASSIGLGSLAMLAACAPQGGDPSKQYGSNPICPSRSNS